jgi:hypothetical protein
MDDMELTQHFSWEEVTRTSSGLPNYPSLQYFENIYYTAGMMEAIRYILGGHPLNVTSWYRNPKVNKAVGGAKKSSHLSGLAVDFTCDELTPYEIVRYLESKRSSIRFDQCIYEKKGEKEWVHISFVIPPTAPRLEVLTLMPDGSYKDGCIFLNKGTINGLA